MNFTGLVMDMFLEPKPGIPPSPQQISSAIKYVRTYKVAAIVQEPFYSPEAAEQVAKETGAKLITLGQSVGELEEAKNYTSLIEFNVQQLLGALKK